VLHITPVEREALQLLAVGAPTARIAHRLGICESEADTLLNALFARMGATSRSDAVAAALRRGLVDQPGGVVTA
jgi:DNA-binding CsgD family transcriptional regulator